MLLPILAPLLASPIVSVFAQDTAQIPLSQHDSLPEKSSSRQHFNFSSPAPHHFHSLHGLAEQWSNTFFPNGHSLVPATIAPYTKLYHGRLDAELPPSPEWLAFDVDMSYGIMGSTPQSHMLTYQTTRRVHVLYFDGESAALMGSGQLDTQMLLIYGNITGPERGGRFRGLGDEYARANGLCDWVVAEELGGPGWGFEGFVRMNAGFELIWCDFASSSLRLVSHLNITTPLLPSAEQDLDLQQDGSLASDYPLPLPSTRTGRSSSPTNPPMPPGWRRDRANQPFLGVQSAQWFLSATRHYGFSGAGPGRGETRLQLDTCGMLTYYSPQYETQARARAAEEQTRLNLSSDGSWAGMHGKCKTATAAKHVALTELTRRRRHHTLAAVSPGDAAAMRAASTRVMRRIISSSGNDGEPQCSGIDWTSIASEVVTRYASDLLNLGTLLSEYANVTNTNPQVATWMETTTQRKWLLRIRQTMRPLLVPFLEYPANTTDPTAWIPGSQTYEATLARCTFHHTRLLAPDARTSARSRLQPERSHRRVGDGYTMQHENMGELDSTLPLRPEEAELKSVVEEVLERICATTIGIGLNAESIWARSNSSPSQSAAPMTPAATKAAHPPPEGVYDTTSDPLHELVTQSHVWTHNVEELMAWLGWASDWTRCEGLCGWDEVCYIPMWPLINSRPWDAGGGGPHGGVPGGYGDPDRTGQYLGPKAAGEHKIVGRSGRNTIDDIEHEEMGHDDHDSDSGGHSFVIYEKDETRRPPPTPHKPPRHRPPFREFPPGGTDDTDLWTPRCVKIEGFLG